MHAQAKPEKKKWRNDFIHSLRLPCVVTLCEIAPWLLLALLCVFGVGSWVCNFIFQKPRHICGGLCFVGQEIWGAKG